MAVNVFPRSYYLLLYYEVYNHEHANARLTKRKMAEKYTAFQF